MRETTVTIASKVNIEGTLAFPEVKKEKKPAILIIPGTGKLDRNGKVSNKVDLQLYRQLAHFLTDLGFITLRYDKRGVGKSEGDYNITGLWDLVDDSQAAIQFLKNVPEVDQERVIVLGHSEGCIIGSAVAAREPIDGLVLVAGAVERLEEALERQQDIATENIKQMKGFKGFVLRLLGTDKKIKSQAQKYMKKVVESNEDTFKIQFQPINAKWMREHFSYNVREDLVKISCPVLAITGARDIQANPNVLKDLATYVQGDSQYHIVENMGHSLKYQAQTSNILTAKKDIVAEASLPLHSELESLLKDWLSKHYLYNRT